MFEDGMWKIFECIKVKYISKENLVSFTVLPYQLISSVVTKDFEQVIRTCELDNWKEALAMALTYAKGDDFSNLCGKLHIIINLSSIVNMYYETCLLQPLW